MSWTFGCNRFLHSFKILIRNWKPVSFVYLLVASVHLLHQVSPILRCTVVKLANHSTPGFSNTFFVVIAPGSMFPDLSVTTSLPVTPTTNPPKYASFRSLENSTLRREFLLALASRVYVGFSTQSDGSRMMKLSRQLKSGSWSSALTLPQPSLILVLATLFSIVVGSYESRNSERNWECWTYEQIKKVVPFVTCEISIGQSVRWLVFGVDIPDLNLGIRINPVKQPIQSNPVGSCEHVSLLVSCLWL